MYLMNVPPVAATQTEWRRCGPPGGFSLPACFNVSDTELSARGTPISDKVQMIIESLRGSQSSLEMGDEIEGNVPPGRDGHAQACKAAAGSYVGVKSKAKSPSGNLHRSSATNQESSDSDSDDSVDRGIEEAILEYLKEKDDHKRKGEPCAALFQSSKLPRKHPTIFEVSKQNSNSSASLISNNQFPRSVKAEMPSPTATVPLKKYIKNKASLDENFNLGKSSKSTSTSADLFNKPINFPVTVKLEEESNDSSSDDGIEEAIQRYQLEKKEQQDKTEGFNPRTFREESDSTSDDGIEAAIRCYQLEQKEKSVPKALLHKQRPFGKSAANVAQSSSSEGAKKQKAKKRKGRMEKQKKSFQPRVSSAVVAEATFQDNSKNKGNGPTPLKYESFEAQRAPAPPKANTTAELMCAEAILDISKTVIPAAFHHGIDLHPCAPTETSVQPPVQENDPYEESNDSSIDSEDGIEQEIRKFLEQKAQMHKQPAESSCGISDPEKAKREDVGRLEKQKLSLTQRQKHKVKILGVSNLSGISDKGKEAALEPLRELTRESNPSEFSQRSQTHPAAVLHKTDKSGDKSSSLDSDEDLDTAIKDLLKTKKKSKKKIRDLKRKSRKLIGDEEPPLGNTLPSKKFKPEPISKFSALKKMQKSKEDTRDKFGLSKKSVTLQKQTERGGASALESAEGGDVLKTPRQMKDDSSSVDSDDSIEQEIRRFLAEKAKGSGAEGGRDGEESRNGSVAVREETQLAEIPRKSTGWLFGSLGPPVPDRTPHRPSSDVAPVSTQSSMSSVQSRSPSLLEPADGVGAARTQQKRPITGRDDILVNTPQVQRGRPVLAPDIAHARAESIKWRQSLGLPISDVRVHGRTPFHIKSSEIADTSPHQNRDFKLQTPTGSWFTSKTSRTPFSGSLEADANAPVRPPVLNFFPASRLAPRMSFARSLPPGNRPQFPPEEEKASTVHVPKDKSVFVELESNRTNHVQVQSREGGEGKERVDSLDERKTEGKSGKIDEEGALQDRKEDAFVDETDCESDSRRDPGQKQGFSTL